jgi:hypothetical protein
VTPWPWRRRGVHTVGRKFHGAITPFGFRNCHDRAYPSVLSRRAADIKNHDVEVGRATIRARAASA